MSWKEMLRLRDWRWVLLLSFIPSVMSSTKLQGGSALALGGKDCVVLAMDKRVGTGSQLLQEGSQRVLKVNGRVLLGMVGYDSLAMAFFEALRSEVNLRSLRLQHHSLGQRSTILAPRALSMLVSDMLYHEFAGGAAPIIAGLDDEGQAVLCTQDSLGAASFQKDFVAIGSCAESILGACESLYRPGLGGEALVRVASQAMRAGLERNCQSGYGFNVYLLSQEGLATREVTGRRD